MKIRLQVLSVLIWIQSAPAFGASLPQQIASFDWSQVSKDPVNGLSLYQNLENQIRELKRTDPDRAEAFELKYQWAHFSMEFRRILVPALRSKRVPRDQIIQLLKDRSFVLSPEQASSLGVPTVVGIPEGRFTVYPLQGTANSRFANWSSNPIYSEGYTIEQDAVLYRGLSLKTGDLISVDLNTKTFGIAGSLQTKDQLTNHGGLLVLIRVQNRILPTVLDIHQAGLRATPLHLFLSQDLSAYAEIVRPVTIDEAARRRIEATVAAILALNESFAFDFSAFDTKPRPRFGYLCTTFINEIFERSGVPTLEGSTEHHPKTQINLLKLGLIASAYLSPSDFLDSPQTEWIGFFENGRARARSLTFFAAQVFGSAMRTRDLSGPKALRAADTNVRGVEAMRDPDSNLGAIIRQVAGIPLEAVPFGEASLIGASVYIDQNIEKAVQFCTEIPTSLCAKHFDGYFAARDPRRFSMKELLGDLSSKNVVSENMKFLEEIFE
jgi:hypothetical protein